MGFGLWISDLSNGLWAIGFESKEMDWIMGNVIMGRNMD